MSDKKPPPIKKFKLRSVEAAIWGRAHEDGTRYSVSFSKSYYDNEKEKYVNSFSFFPEEAALLPVLATQAVTWISEQKVEKSVPEGEKPF